MGRTGARIAGLALLLVLLGLVSLGGGGAATLPGGWEQVGTNKAAPTQSALNGIVLALNTDQPGVMYVGGNFTDAGGDPNADYIARWDGSTWKALGVPKLNGQVTAIAYRNGKVYAGGTFSAAGGDTNAGFVAVWDGTNWSPVCKPSGPGGNVYALEISGSTIYIGGAFQRGAGIANANYLLACDLNSGAARALVPGYTSSVVAGLGFDTRGTLYAGGSFGDLDGVPGADYVAAYTGGKWLALGSGTGQGAGAVTDRVRSLTVSGTDVYIGGDFTDVAGIPQADMIAQWDGSKWSALGANSAGTNGIFAPTSSVYAIRAAGSRVYVGGAFANANGNPLADNLVVFDGHSWDPLGSNGSGDGALRADVHAIAVFDGKVYAGGNFTSVGGVGAASFLVAIPLATPLGGGGGGGGAPGPATGTATGTVLVNGTPFTGGTIPYGASVDVTNGRLTMKTEAGPLTVYGGGLTSKFKLVRAGSKKVDLRLTGGDFSACRKVSRAGGQMTTKTVRRLWSKGKGSFRTQARFSSASVQGTFWLTDDRCDGTWTSVKQGVVTVRDLVKKKTVRLRAGQGYLAKAR
jgi:hypothetical protein